MKTAAVATLTATVLPLGATCFAQAVATEATSADRDGSGEIVVTARRREERLQDVPVAVTALSPETLKNAAVAGLTDITRVAPSLNVTQSAGGGRSIPLFTLRGQRQGDTLASVDPSVGVYMGDVLFKRTFGLNQLIFDMSTIEVQKGAQGTLFGLNTTGGNVIFRPAAPTDRFEGSVMAGIGNYDDRRIEAFVNVPLGEGAALRVAGRYEKRDGYIHTFNPTGVSLEKATFRGNPTEADAAFVKMPIGRSASRDQDLDGGGVRVSLKLNPTDRLESTFVGHYLRSSTGGSGFRLSALFAPSSISFANPGLDLGQVLQKSQDLPYYQTNARYVAFSKSNSWNIANTTTQEISDAVTLKNIIGYRKYKSSGFENIDGTDRDFIDYGTRFSGKEFTEEFQVVGQADELNWIVGGFYGLEDVSGFSYTTAIGAIGAFSISPFAAYEDVKNTTKAVFGQATQKLDNIVEGLSLTLGGRYTWDKREASFGSLLFPVGGGRSCFFANDPAVSASNNPYGYDPSTCLVDLSKKFSKFTYSGTLDWKINRDLLVYFSNRKGYRSGGFGTRAQSAFELTPFNPDTVVDFEIGSKYAHSFDGGAYLSTNVALYKSNYKDIQRLVPFRQPSGSVSTLVANAASATIKGFEVETTFRPNRFFEFGGFVSHTDASYDEFFIAGPVAETGCTAASCDIASVARFSGVPRWQFGVNGRVNLPISPDMGKTSLQLNYYHQSSYTMQDRTLPQPTGVTPGYGLLNGRIEWTGVVGSRLDLAIYATNLLDNKYLTGNYSLATELGLSSTLAGAPRMYGLEARYSF